MNEEENLEKILEEIFKKSNNKIKEEILKKIEIKRENKENKEGDKEKNKREGKEEDKQKDRQKEKEIKEIVNQIRLRELNKSPTFSSGKNSIRRGMNLNSSRLENLSISRDITLEQDVSFISNTKGFKNKKYDGTGYNEKYSENRYDEKTPDYIGKNETTKESARLDSDEQ